jgi:hypothetical protein
VQASSSISKAQQQVTVISSLSEVLAGRISLLVAGWALLCCQQQAGGLACEQ